MLLLYLEDRHEIVSYQRNEQEQAETHAEVEGRGRRSDDSGEGRLARPESLLAHSLPSIHPSIHPSIEYKSEWVRGFRRVGTAHEPENK